MIKATVDIPISAAERAEMQARELKEIEFRQRRATFERNRAAGKPVPKPGTKLYVATVRGLKTRGRAGLQFSEAPAEVLVIDAEDAEVLAKQKQGAYVVNPDGAELILDDCNGPDKGLVFWPSKPGDAVQQLETTSTEALEAELARRKAAPAMKGEPRIGATNRNGNDPKDHKDETKK